MYLNLKLIFRKVAYSLLVTKEAVNPRINCFEFYME